MVKLVRENLKVMTLAIGDGANDVSMLQTAEVSKFSYVLYLNGGNFRKFGGQILALE